MLRSDHFPNVLMPATALLVLCACSTTSPRATQAVLVLLKANATQGPTQSAALQITGVRLVIRQTSLGDGEEFGCVDCQNANREPAVLTVPLDGSPVSVAAERIAPGHYSAVEIQLVPPSSALLVATPGWSTDATIEVRGRYNGTAFILPLAIPGQFRETLSHAIDVPAGGLPGPINVTITLPVASWFASNGLLLDPDDRAARAQITANARAAVDAGSEVEKEGTEH